MEIAVTKGIKITVQTQYIESHSRPTQNHFAHAYRITIENQSSEIVQLLRRHWYIQDGTGTIREVEGEGVVGEQPVLSPGQIHQYSSWCPMGTMVGRMYGNFTMQYAKNREEFKVQVPEFALVVPNKLN